MTSDLDKTISFKVKFENIDYKAAVDAAVDEIISCIQTDMEILDTTRKEWLKRKNAGTLTPEFESTCKEVADSLKKNIDKNKKLLI